MAEIVDAEKTITIALTPASTCPTPIVTYTRFPEIWFEGTKAFCEVKIDVGTGNTVDPSLSTIELYDGVGWVDVPLAMAQISSSASVQTVILEWTMRGNTDRAVCNCWIASSCGTTTTWISTDYYKYPIEEPPVPCPDPTAGFLGIPKIWFDGNKANCRMTFYAGEGRTVDLANSSFTGYDGVKGVDLKHLINASLSTQTITATWEMVASTTRCYANVLLRNDCGNFATANTGDHSYTVPAPPAPPPTNGGDPSSTAIPKSLEVGDYNIEVSKSGFETVTAKITVSSSGLVSCTDTVCLASGYPRVEAPGTTSSVRVYMAEGVAVTSYTAWVASKGGAAGIRGKLAPVGNIIDGYLSSVGDIGYLGFTVTLGNVGSTIDYYLG